MKSEKLKIKSVKLTIFFIFLFFVGCSEKSVNIYAVAKPNENVNNQVRYLKIENLKNDKVHLKEKIVQQLNEVKKLMPNYFHLWQNQPSLYCFA